MAQQNNAAQTAQLKAQDDAARERIINHMNKDHHDSIILYLEHYCKLSTWLATNDSSLKYIDLNVMSFQCSGEQFYAPFEPALRNYGEARERVTQMDQECRRALKRSDITINEFLPPTGLHLLLLIMVVTTFIGYSQRWWFDQGGPVENVLGASFAAFSWTIQPWLISGLFLIHGTELVLFVPWYLKKHCVNPRSSVFWLWAASTFFEGQFGWMRFRALVDRKREEKQKRKH